MGNNTFLQEENTCTKFVHLQNKNLLVTQFFKLIIISYNTACTTQLQRFTINIAFFKLFLGNHITC